jgi:hypothetical protein
MPSPDPDFPPRISIPFYAKSVAFNADASRLYVVAEGDLLGLPRGGQPHITFEAVEGHRPQALAVSPKGGAVACTTDSGIALVDLDPAPAGKLGQVILFFHDDGKRLCVADSVGAWLAAIAADLEAGSYEYDADSQSWSDEALLQSNLEGKDTYG